MENSIIHLSLLEDNKEKYLKENTMIIFDWDDTIMCSSFMIKSNINLESSVVKVFEHWKELSILSDCAIKMLTNAKKYGDVVIVTNADDLWVRLSAQKFMPELIPILQTLKIFSAKNLHVDKHPNDFYMWKYLTIKSLLTKYNIKNALSFGDSLIERSGLFNVCKSFPEIVPKSIKFIDEPSIEALAKQIERVDENIKYFVTYDGVLDLQLLIKKNE